MHYRMVESYRMDNRVKHQTILHLGGLEELPDIEHKKALGKRIDEMVKQKVTGTQSLFVASDDKVEQLAGQFAVQIIEKYNLDTDATKDYHLIDTETLRSEDVREVGAEWLCRQALEQLNLGVLLKQNNWSDQQIQLAYTHIISRAVYPASELATSRWIKQNSAVCELTGYDQRFITKDKLYGISHSLYALKDKIEKHLSHTTNELFDLDDSLIIYDLTNTYYEGRMLDSKIAAYGRSKEKRSDAKLIVLAVVINTEGFIKYSHIFEGSRTDAKSVVDIIEHLSSCTSQVQRKPIIVIDAGIATEDNLSLLRRLGYDYLCVSRSGLTHYQIDPGSQPVTITDKRKQVIILQKVAVPGSTDHYLQVHSQAKEAKERSMHCLFEQRFETGLKQIQAALHKKRGTKKADKVWQRIGRLKQKYPRIQKYYDITTTSNEAGQVTTMQWKQKIEPSTQGYYLLRTTLDEKQEQVQWKIYNTIREVESTFRLLKTDLDLRPIYHKTDAASTAHLHLGLLAYWVVNTIRYQLKQKSIHHQWSELVRIMNTQKLVTTKMTNQYDQQVVIRKCSEPTQQVKNIFDALKYKHRPFTRKKHVVPPTKIKKNENTDSQQIMPP